MADERLTEATKTKEAMEALTNHFGWKMLLKVFKEKEEHLLNRLFNPGADMDDLEIRETRMAIISLRMSAALPDHMLNVSEEVIQEFADMASMEEEAQQLDEGEQDGGEDS